MERALNALAYLGVAIVYLAFLAIILHILYRSVIGPTVP